ncbi:pentapeptide repeat-containing protein [Fibrella aquatica]|uniref:pentapeptide repeat-containing protein n=1 Tax=Fibrella aquatica TaxID=3242487 RepID=UPI00352215FE
MADVFLINEQFEQINYTKIPLPTGEYELCRFIGCDFTKSSLAGSVFYDCEFIDCQLSGVKLTKTAFRDVRFRDCKAEGLHFEHCNDFLFAVSFDSCVLTKSSFYKQKIKNTSFKKSILHEVDFMGADLTGADFDESDLRRAAFENTILEKADLRTAYNYSLDPELNRLSHAKFSLSGVAGLLVKYNIDIE